MTVTESGPVSLAEPSSAFTLPLMDCGSVFGGYYGFVKPGLWRLTEELAAIDRELGIEFKLDARVERVDPERGTVRYRHDGVDRVSSFDHLVFATDPTAAARLVGDEETVKRIAKQRVLGSSGKITLFFRQPVRWKDGPEADRDAAFRFIFSTETLADFERATVRVRAGDVDYEPGYIQVYCEGAAMRRLGLTEPYDRLTLFFKNLGLGRKGDELDDVKTRVTAQLLAHVANPEDCVWSRLLTPKDLQELFLFPGGNLDHTELTGGQQFADRQFAADPAQEFYRFGSWSNLTAVPDHPAGRSPEHPATWPDPTQPAAQPRRMRLSLTEASAVAERHTTFEPRRSTFRPNAIRTSSSSPVRRALHPQTGQSCRTARCSNECASCSI
jgi:phytoene dehydrogenase-like protein